MIIQNDVVLLKTHPAADPQSPGPYSYHGLTCKNLEQR